MSDNVLELQSNDRSDRKAKEYFERTWSKKDYCNPSTKKADCEGVDAIAFKDGKKHYFEIKKTSKKIDGSAKYFGAVTLTEWECYLKHKDCFHFLIMSSQNNEDFDVIEYIPDNLMNESTIPPFKTYFNIDFVPKNVAKKTTSVRANMDNIKLLINVYNSMKVSVQEEDFTLEEHLDLFLKDIEMVKKLKPYLSFPLMAVMIEVLGKLCCCDNIFDDKTSKQKIFDEALKSYPSLEKYAKLRNGEGEKDCFYIFFRCSFIHSSLPKGKVCYGPDKNDIKNKIIGASDLYKDICDAWKLLKNGKKETKINIKEKVMHVNSTGLSGLTESIITNINQK